MATTEQTIMEWRRERWPKPDDNAPAAHSMYDVVKLAEEVGEVAGAFVKLEEGRADLGDVRDELGDVLIAISVLAGSYGWSINELRYSRWSEVGER